MNPNNHLRSTGIAASIIAVGLALSGCNFSLNSIAENFGPEPDSALVKMAFSAEDEAANFAESHPGLSELRAGQAGAIFEEIARICGHYPDGTSPTTCEIDRAQRSNYDGEHAVASTPEQALELFLAALADAPQQSYPLLIEQAVALAETMGDHEATVELTAEKLPLEPPSTPANWDALVDWEYRLGYGLEMARAFSSGEDAQRIDEAAAQSDARLALLRQHGIARPERALAYNTGNFPEGLNDTNTQQFVTHALEETSQRWKQQAVEATDASWQKLAVLFAAETKSNHG